MDGTRVKRGLMMFVLVPLMVGAVALLPAKPAAADGCVQVRLPVVGTLYVFCGILRNRTPDQTIRYRYDGANGEWIYREVSAGRSAGGSGIDVDFWFIPQNCTDYGTVLTLEQRIADALRLAIGGPAPQPTPFVRNAASAEEPVYGGGWAKFRTTDLVTITRRVCVAPQPDPPPPPPPPTTPCVAPAWPPTTKSYINLFTDATARIGPYLSCGYAGTSYTYTNPQYVYCRTEGDVVSDASGAYNKWWLWTDLDTGGKGWIPAYYIAGQGNDQADDIVTGNPIPHC